MDSIVKGAAIAAPFTMLRWGFRSTMMDGGMSSEEWGLLTG